MTNNSKTTKNDIYATVTALMIAKLEQGVCPWKSPYLGSVGYPQNFATSKVYRGVNVWLLGMLGFSSPYFLTFVQTKALGGHVRKGEKGSLVVKWGTFETEDKDSGEDKTRGFLKSYTVFNASQIEGIAFPAAEVRIPQTDCCGDAKMIIAAMPNRPMIRYGTAMAFYRPADDSISMPNMDDMTSPESFYSTLFHEVTHSVGALHRLNRKSLVDNNGMHASRQTYAEEELVAEMGSAFLCAHSGIFDDQSENSAAYLAGWLKALQNPDAKTWIVRAAGQAQKAADYVLNIPRA